MEEERKRRKKEMKGKKVINLEGFKIEFFQNLETNL